MQSPLVLELDPHLSDMVRARTRFSLVITWGWTGRRGEYRAEEEDRDRNIHMDIGTDGQRNRKTKTVIVTVTVRCGRPVHDPHISDHLIRFHRATNIALVRGVFRLGGGVH